MISRYLQNNGHYANAQTKTFRFKGCHVLKHGDNLGTYWFQNLVFRQPIKTHLSCVHRGMKPMQMWLEVLYISTEKSNVLIVLELGRVVLPPKSLYCHFEQD